MTLFNRQVSAQVNDEIYRSGPNGFRVAFRVAKKLRGKDKSKATVKVWNPSQEYLQGTLDDPGIRRDFLRLFAGHDSGRGLIFEGDIIPRGARFDRQAGDIVFTAQGRANYRRERTANIKLELPRGATGDEVVAACTEALGINIDTGDFPAELVFNEGLSFNGSAVDLLNEITSQAGIDVAVRGSGLILIGQGATAGNLARVFSRDNGTLLSPPRPKSGAKNKRLLSMRVLFTPEMEPGYRFTVEDTESAVGFSGDRSGIYKAINVTHVGDSGYTSDYYTDVDMLPSPT